MTTKTKTKRRLPRIVRAGFTTEAYPPHKAFTMLWVQRGGGYNVRRFYLEGTAALLYAEYLEGRCELGIVFDRLQDYPEEARPSMWMEPNDVTEGVDWLRKN